MVAGPQIVTGFPRFLHTRYEISARTRKEHLPLTAKAGSLGFILLDRELPVAQMADKKRAGKIGIAYEVEAKLEHNYDREQEAGTPKCIADWINGILEGEPYFTEKLNADDWKNFCMQLRNGVVLCQLINKLLKQDGKSPIKFQTRANSPFIAMTNIECFNDGAMKYGLAQEFTFQSGDLYEVRKGGFYNCINCLHSLGFVANSKAVMPAYCGEIQKTIDRE